MSQISNGLTHYFAGGGLWKLEMQAAELVPNRGVSQLPDYRGPIGFLALPERYCAEKLPRHPILDIYSHIEVVYNLMVIKPSMLVQRTPGGPSGVPIFQDWTNTNILSASLVSANGRNPLAPPNWNGPVGSMNSPHRETALGFRPVIENGTMRQWQNHYIHGSSLIKYINNGPDWCDGSPDSASTMFDHEGLVSQFLFVVNNEAATNLGVAEQTIGIEDVTNTYSVLVWASTDTQRALCAQRSADRIRQDTLRGDAFGPDSKEIGNEIKMAFGGKIRQQINQDPFSPALWPPAPEVLFVNFPVFPETARRIWQEYGESFINFRPGEKNINKF